MQYRFVSCLGRFTQQRCFTLALLAAAFAVISFTSAPAQAQTFAPLYNFPGGNAGFNPSSLLFTPVGLVGSADYGTCPCDLIFDLSGGKEKVLHRFVEPSGYQSEVPAGFVLSNNGAVLYGTTEYGGKENGECTPPIGCGLVFATELSTGKTKVLHEFTANPDGANPSGNLVIDPAGNLYGITFGGGTDNNGTVFEITAAGVEKVLYSFGKFPDAMQPATGLIRDSSGNLYGGSVNGGDGACVNGPLQGCGAIFKVTPTGVETVVYSFTGGSDGNDPEYLIGDNSGNVYGVSRTTSNVVQGLFEVSADGAFSVVYDGSYVSQIISFIFGPSGSFYVMANGGDPSCGSNGCGQILQLTPTGNGTGTVDVLHSFNGNDGFIPDSLLLKNGVLYGSTAYGGPDSGAGNGVVYKLVP